jgi:hypothetical protein
MASTPDKTYNNTFRILFTKKFIALNLAKEDPKISVALLMFSTHNEPEITVWFFVSDCDYAVLNVR